MNAAQLIYRVQANDGRGPFRPGFTVRWSDMEGEPRLPTFIEEFKTLEFEAGWHYGTGVRTRADIDRWFTATEQAKLATLGFFIACLSVDRIIAESKNQLVFARKLPLREGVVVQPWPWEGDRVRVTVRREP